MFGFPLLRALSIMPLKSLTLEDLGTSYFCKEPDLTSAKLLDVYSYAVNGIHYEQKVYRLKDGAIYTSTSQNTEISKQFLEEKLKEAVQEEDYELAAHLKKKLKSLE